MKNILFTLLLLPFLALSQTEKGASPISYVEATTTGTTYAVVVGISDYQDEGIPDLRFADKDAEAFANFLRSPAGGSLDGDHLKLLTDSAATTAQFDAALGWLIDESKEGDQAIIYFSGHGDVETKTRSQQGFLLCWDSPPQAYVSGAYPIFFLKEVISTLSLENKSKVIVITDACRSGKLAGNSIGGSQLTSQNLSQQFANEIKILSCQPNEYSIEGEQWGGGRGAFSYYLVDGLYGMADGNTDGSVNLMEIGRYLDDHVTTEVAPESQVPMTVGNRTEKLAMVFPELLAEVQKSKSGQLNTFTSTDSRGLEDEILATVDTTTQQTYRLFKKAVKEKVFLEPIGACADAYYERLIAESKLERLHNSMRRNYAAALQDDAQQVLNTMLKTGLTNEVLDGDDPAEIYKDYPHWLDRAAELLGQEHYMYPVLQARKHFFEGKATKEKLAHRLQYQKSLAWQPNQPQTYAELIGTCDPSEVDSAEFFARRAKELSPQWQVPYIQLARFYEFRLEQPSKADSCLDEAAALDSNSVLVWFTRGIFEQERQNFDKAAHAFKHALAGVGKEVRFNYAYLRFGDMYIDLGRYEDAEEILLEAVQLDSNYGGTLNRLGKVYWRTGRYSEAEAAFKKQLQLDTYKRRRVIAFNELGNLYWAMNKLPEAEEYYFKAIKADSLFDNPYFNLANLYTQLGRYEEAEQMCKQVLQIESSWGSGRASGHIELGYTYALMGRFEDAVANAKKSLELDPLRFDYYTYACILSMANKLDEAFDVLEEAIKKGYNDFEWLQQDADVAALRAQKERWEALMEKYFPEEK